MIFSESDLQLPDFTEPLPKYTPLTVEEIRAIARFGLGLRATHPQRTGTELTQGVEGDYIILSDVSHLISFRPDAFNQLADTFGIPTDNQSILIAFKEAIAYAIIRGDREDLGLELFADLQSLPQKYEEALYNFMLKKALPLIIYPINETTLLKAVLRDLPTEAVFSLLLLTHKGREGYDHDNYYGLGKNGRAFIAPERFIQTITLSQEAVDLLYKRYQPFLDLPAITRGAIKSRQKLQLFQSVDQDVCKVILGETIKTVRNVISASKGGNQL